MRVSIVINNHDYERFLPRAVGSALAQTHPDVEVVVVDDGSTDGSRALIAGYGDRIIAVLKENGGQASAVNRGFAVCTGDVVIFLDADDELLPHAAERVCGEMLPDVAKVHFRLAGIDADGVPLGWTHPSAAVSLPSGDLSGHVARVGSYVTPVMSGNAFSRLALTDVLPVPEEDFRISADGYLVVAAALRGRVAAIDEVLGLYRLHGHNAWSATELDVSRLARYVDHDLKRHDAVRRLTRQRDPRRRMGHRDRGHLQRRLCSLRLAPARHPAAGDRAVGLALSGIRSALLEPGHSLHGRLLLAGWFAVMAVAPRPVAVRVARRALVHRRRPASAGPDSGGHRTAA